MKPIEYWINKIHCGDAFELLKQIPSESVDCVITSPPYYGLRTYGKYTQKIFDENPNCSHEWNEYIKPKERGSYGKSSWHRPSRDNEPKWNSQVSQFCVKCNAWKGELGLEPDYTLYVKHLVDLFREVKRVLKKTGSFWLNIGDTYASAGGPSRHHGCVDPKYPKGRNITFLEPQALTQKPYQPKCLMLIPMRVALALIDDGWILRNVIIWRKLNAMPSSAKDRLAQTYEYVLHFVKSRKYYYNLDNIRIPHKTKFAPFNLRVRDVKRGKGGISAFGALKASEKEVENYVYPEKHDLAVGRVGNFSYTDPLHTKEYHLLGKNPGDVWEMSTRPLKEMHFAPFPLDLPLRPILATCPPDGIVLDPLAGSGTVALTCELINHGKWDEFKLYVNETAKKQKWNIKWIMIEMSPEYCMIAEKRLHKTLDISQSLVVN